MPAAGGVKFAPVASTLPPVGVLYQRTSESELTPAPLTRNSGIASPSQIVSSPKLCGAAIGAQVQSGASNVCVISQPAALRAVTATGMPASTPLILKKPFAPPTIPKLDSKVTSACVLMRKL